MPLNIAIIMGSSSDAPQMNPVISGVHSSLQSCAIISAHRTPERLLEYAQTASAQGIHIIIAAAGWSAHLAGVTASLVNEPIPVLAIPLSGGVLGRIDSFGSCIQMPPGVPLGVVSKPESIPTIIQNISSALAYKNASTILVLYDEHLKDPLSALSEQWLLKNPQITFITDTQLSPAVQEQIKKGDIQTIIYQSEEFLLASQLTNLNIPVIFSPCFDKEEIAKLSTSQEKDECAMRRMLKTLQQADQSPHALFTSCNGFLNAVLLALRIYGLKHPEIQALLQQHREKMKEDSVISKQENVWKEHIKSTLGMNPNLFFAPPHSSNGKDQSELTHTTCQKNSFTTH